MAKKLVDPYVGDSSHPSLFVGQDDDDHPQDGEEEDDTSHERSGRGDPEPTTYKPPIPYPHMLERNKGQAKDNDDHLLEANKQVEITIPLVDEVQFIPSYAKFLKGLCTPQRKPKRLQLNETMSSIILDTLPIKKGEPGAPMITTEIGGTTFTRSLLVTGASVNILPKAIFDQF